MISIDGNIFRSDLFRRIRHEIYSKHSVLNGDEHEFWHSVGSQGRGCVIVGEIDFAFVFAQNSEKIKALNHQKAAKTHDINDIKYTRLLCFPKKKPSQTLLSPSHTLHFAHSGKINQISP